MVAYMTAAYNKANKAFFDGRLKKPNLELTRAVDAAKFKGRGKYVYGPRQLFISPTLFNPGVEALVLTTIVHEMCHQAVYELDGVRPPQLNVDGGHGAEWSAWMHRCGLQPQRYDTYDNKMYLDPKKQALLADRSAALAKATDTEDRIASSDITVGMQVVLKASGQVFIGLVYKLPINGKVQVLCPRERSGIADLYSVPDDICFRPKQSLTPFFSTKFMLYAAKLGLSR
jgi:predicted SprT family Zn-dependent metalloprotease